MRNRILGFIARNQWVGRGAIFAVVQFALFPSAYAAIELRGAQDVVSKVLCPVFDTMFTILIALAAIMVIWAAYIYLRAGDDSEKVSKAHKTITYAAVAVVVALIAKGFPVLISSIFPGGTIPGFNCGGGGGGGSDAIIG
ncbi:MAG: hypothetical protein HY434_02610 [Candidatus Liptonbacteria bacterium]|nr:hypothetical protein [Candidatus Liptonbacteria bacterium]